MRTIMSQVGMGKVSLRLEKDLLVFLYLDVDPRTGLAPTGASEVFSSDNTPPLDLLSG